MGGALIANDNPAAAGGIPLPFALHQHMDAPVERGDLALLTGDNLRKVLDRAGQMGDLFF